MFKARGSARSARPSPRGEVVQRSSEMGPISESDHCSPRDGKGGTGTQPDRGLRARLRGSGRPTPMLGGVVRSDAYRKEKARDERRIEVGKMIVEHRTGLGRGRAGTEVEREIIEGLRQSHESNRSLQQMGFAHS